MVLKRVGVGSAAKVSGALYAAIGLIMGLIFACIAMVGGAMSSGMSQSGAMPAFVSGFFGVGAIIFLPIFYGVMGFIGGAIAAWVYNLVAGMAGGLELDLE